MTTKKSIISLTNNGGIALYYLLVVFPMLAAFVYAFLYSFGVVGVFSEGVTVRHWAALFSSSELARSIGLSIVLAFFTTLLSVFIGLLTGLALHEHLRKGVFSTIAHIPLAIPPVVAAFAIIQLCSGSGFAARLLLACDVIGSLAEFPSLVHDALGIGIVCAFTVTAAPFFALLFAELYESENVRHLEELAATLGASRLQRRWRVSIPLLVRRAGANITLLFVAVLGGYEIPLLLGLQSPQMLSVLAHRKYAMFDLAEKPQAFVLAVVYTALVLVLLSVPVIKTRQTRSTVKKP